tara:strand:- start:1026 stop:1610 length:585 start_codon:yes stop_codon:yes gene_type:complete
MYNKKPIILIDVDGVLADFLTPTLNLINGIIEHPVTEKDITQWDIFKSIKSEKHDIEKICFEEYSKDGFALSLKPYSNCIDSINHINNIANLYFVTVPVVSSKTWCHDRVAWLKKYFNINDEQVIFTHKKSLVRGNMLIDDRIEYVKSWSKAHQNGTAILWKQPYNQYESHDLILNDWDFIVKKVERMCDAIIL